MSDDGSPPADAVVTRLRRAGCVNAEAEATELRTVATTPDDLEAALIRRERGEPLEWITGTARFGPTSLHIRPGLYVPRHQSEELARRAAARLAAAGPAAAAVDLCTGTGAVAARLQAEVPAALVVGVDIDPRAAGCAQHNGVRAVVGDVSATPLRAAVFDVVTAVAPYVPTGSLALLPRDVREHEPHPALDGGGDGLDVVRAVAGAATRLLRPGGWLLIEVGGRQDEILAATLTTLGFDHVGSWSDADGDLRGMSARAHHR